MPANWRTGTKNNLNVYEGDRSVCQCHNPEDAARIVAGMNYAADRITDVLRNLPRRDASGRPILDAK